MKIVGLNVENVKRLKAVNITPDGNVVVIGGRNEQGKSSLLDSIMYALSGKRHFPQMPIRNGENKGKIVCDLGEFTVTRTITHSGGTLTVESKDGARYKSPQAMLDKLTGELTFDPLDFSKMDAGRQLETLKRMVGLDFSALDQEKAGVYNQRTSINREGKELKARLDGMPESHKDVPAEELNIDEMFADLGKKEKQNVENNEQRARLSNLNRDLDNLDSEIADLEKKLSDFKESRSQMAQTREDLSKEVKALKDADTDEIRRQIKNVSEINRKVRENKDRARLAAKLDDLRTESQSKTDRIKEIEDRKTRAMAEAKFPVEGLSFDETGVLYKRLPFSQCSSAEKLNVSVAMGIAMNPELRVMLIRDGSLLDADHLRIISDIVTENDFQLWLEKVGDGDDCAVIIEDGMVLGAGLGGGDAEPAVKATEAAAVDAVAEDIEDWR